LYSIVQYCTWYWFINCCQCCTLFFVSIVIVVLNRGQCDVQYCYPECSWCSNLLMLSRWTYTLLGRHTLNWWSGAYSRVCQNISRKSQCCSTSCDKHVMQVVGKFVGRSQLTANVKRGLMLSWPARSARPKLWLLWSLISIKRDVFHEGGVLNFNQEECLFTKETYFTKDVFHEGKSEAGIGVCQFFRCACRTADFRLSENCQFLAEDPLRRIPLVSHLPVSAVDVAQQNFSFAWLFWQQNMLFSIIWRCSGKLCAIYVSSCSGATRFCWLCNSTSTIDRFQDIATKYWKSSGLFLTQADAGCQVNLTR